MRIFYNFLRSFSFLIICCSFANGQSNCGKASDLWKDYKSFIPSEESPVFTVRVNFVIPQRSDGSGNFTADDEEAVAMFDLSIKGCNDLWSNLKVPKDPDCYPGTDHLKDPFIRFVLNEVIYIQDDFYWNGENGSGCPNNRNWFMNPLDDELRSNPKYANAINVYLPNMGAAYQELIVEQSTIEHPKAPPPCSELPSYKDLGRSSRINLAGAYNKYYWMQYVFPADSASNVDGHPWDPVVYGWQVHSFYSTLAHELGHSMGLGHANEYHGRNKCDESIMNQLHGKPHNYLQPSEIGKIHRNLRMSNIRDFIVGDPYATVPLIISEDTEYTMDYKAYENIVVESGVTFHVHCALSMHEKAKIIVKPGATLLVQADITSRSAQANNTLVEVQRERWRLFGNKHRKVGNVTLAEKGQLLGTTESKKVKRKKQ